MYLRIILSIISIYLFTLADCCLAGCGGFKESIGVYCDDVQALHDKGIITGYEDGEFKFFKLLSRRELTKMVVLAKAKIKIYNISESEIEEYGKIECFSDVEAGGWASKYICYANDKKNNIVNGCNEKANKFCPDNIITYDEASKIILKALSDGTNCWKNNNGIWYTYYVEYMNNILNANISHSEKVTRALFAHMLNTAMKEENANFIQSCLDEDGLLAKYSPLMSFYEDDKNPVAIDEFIKHSILYTTSSPHDDDRYLPDNITWYFGADLPSTIKAKKVSTYNFISEVQTIEKNFTFTIPYSQKISEKNIFGLKGSYFFDFRNGKHGGYDYSASYFDAGSHVFTFDENISFNPNVISSSSDKAIYGRVLRNSGKIYLKYFFFYLMNDWNQYNPIGFHEGDWEGVVIELDSNQNPVRMGVSIHGKYEHSKTKHWNDVIKLHEHPYLYIGHGGHPTYFNVGIAKYGLGSFTDDHNGEGRVLYHQDSEENGWELNHAATKTPYRIVNVENNSSTKSWFVSNIYWGRDYSDISTVLGTSFPFQDPSVASPGSACSHDPERWSNPKRWLDCNLQCTGVDTVCGDSYCKEEVQKPDYCPY